MSYYESTEFVTFVSGVSSNIIHPQNESILHIRVRYTGGNPIVTNPTVASSATAQLRIDREWIQEFLLNLVIF